MSDPATLNPTTPEDGRRSIRLPRPLWIGLAALVLAVVGGGLRIGIPICRQQAEIREIERVGGRVAIERGGPNWLRRRVGDDWMTPFDIVTSVDLSDSHAADGTLTLVPRFNKLRHPNLGGTSVTDAGVAQIEGLTSLEVLRLSGTQVTDTGLIHLSGLTKLCWLELGKTRVSDASVPMLCKLKVEPGHGLYLDARGTRISNSGIGALEKTFPNARIAR